MTTSTSPTETSSHPPDSLLMHRAVNTAVQRVILLVASVLHRVWEIGNPLLTVAEKKIRVCLIGKMSMEKRQLN